MSATYVNCSLNLKPMFAGSLVHRNLTAELIPKGLKLIWVLVVHQLFVIYPPIVLQKLCMLHLLFVLEIAAVALLSLLLFLSSAQPSSVISYVANCSNIITEYLSPIKGVLFDHTTIFIPQNITMKCMLGPESEG